MSESRPGSDAARDGSARDRVDEIAIQFESAWKQSLRGGAKPDPAEYAARASGEQRDAVRAVLARIDREFRQLADGNELVKETVDYDEDLNAADRDTSVPNAATADTMDFENPDA